MKLVSDLYIKTSEVASVLKKLAVLTVIGCMTAIPAVVNAQTINTKVTVSNSSGSKTTKGQDSVQNISGATLNKDIKTEAVQVKKDVAAKADARRKEDAKDVNYTGVYNGRQIVPDTMAIYCKTNAEQFLADTSLIDKCLNRYLAAMNNSNASLRADGVKDYNALLLRLALDAYGTALTKAASVTKYEDVQNEMGSNVSKANDERTTGAGISNSVSVATDVINSLRELYATSVFLEAVQGLEAVDPSVLDQDVVAEVEAESDLARRDVSESVESHITAEADLEIPVETEEDITTMTPDEIAEEEAKAAASAAEEETVDGGTLPNVTVTGNSPLNQLENMSPEEFAQNKDRVETIRANLTKQMNAPGAEDWEIADAQRSLERLAAIEKKQAEALAAKKVAEEPALDGGTLPNVTVTGNSPLNQLENMSPEEFAQNKDRVEAIRANLTKQMNAPGAEDWEIADAQRSLERLAAIEAKQNATGGK